MKLGQRGLGEKTGHNGWEWACLALIPFDPWVLTSTTPCHSKCTS